MFAFRKPLGQPYKKGITLIEMMLAATVLVFAVVSILAAYISCFSLISSLKSINIATNATIGLTEQIRSSPFARIMDDYNGLNFVVNELVLSRGVVYIDDTNPELLRVTISVCWRQKSNRVVGEDSDLDGVLDPGEDANNNGIIDSPVQIVTLIANR